MSNFKKDLKRVGSNQGRLFENDLREGALNIRGTFRDALSKAIRGCGAKTRYEISARISELTDRSITKDMLDKYTSACPDCGFRAEDLPAFCAAVGSVEPLRLLAEAVGYELVGAEEAELIRLARLEQEVAIKQEEIARLRAKNKIGKC